MIVEMKKYGLLIYHKEYVDFLHELQDRGIIHTLQTHDRLDKGEIEGAESFAKKIDDIIRYLSGRKTELPATHIDMKGAEIVEDIANERNNLSKLEKKRDQLDRTIHETLPWGTFDDTYISHLAQHEVFVHLFTCKKTRFHPEWHELYPLEIIYKDDANIYFVIVSREDKAPELDEAVVVKHPEQSLAQLQEQKSSIEKQVQQIEEKLDLYAANSIPKLRETKAEVLSKLAFDQTLINTESQAEGELMVLEGYVPISKEQEFEEMLDEKKIFFIKDAPDQEENIPVLLKEGGWAKLFHPITRLFSLPSYFELDLTPFFAPFFLLFFGFCLGDAGYGILLLVSAIIFYFRTSSLSQKRLMQLAMLLGIGTTLFGALSGTFFGIQLADVQMFQQVKERFLNFDQLLILSIILGIVQIVFGILIKGYKKIRHKKYVHALSDLGWILLIASILDLMFVNISPYISQYTIWIGLVGILLFSKPEAPLLERLGAGIWGLYNITGIFGDVLSYIRLFALGVSSSILGLVINNIALEFSGTPYIGPVLLIIILVFGHSINIFISALGAFVHPLRLTFVEFYKNAGFTGGGVPYTPFSHYNQHKD